MAQLCPRIDPLRPITPDRNLPGTLLYGATCLPGTATTSGCINTYLIAIPWSEVTGPGGTPAPGGGVTRTWIAPGGNRYWSNAAPGIKADPNSPTAKALLRLMADRSRMHFHNVFTNWKDYRNLTMATVLDRYQGKLVKRYGIVKIEIEPDPNETAEHFARRGGYLLWVDPQTGAFTSHEPIDWYRPTWVSSNIETAQLFGYYNLATGYIEYSVRVRYKDKWEKAVAGSLGRINEAMDYFCSKLTSQKVMAVATVAKLYPSPDVQVYVKAYQAAVLACGTRATFNAQAAIEEPCEPRPDQPLPPATPIVGGWKTTMTAQAGQIHTPTLSPGITSPLPPVSRYSEGTIAWLDPSVGIYRIASPLPSTRTTHAVMAPQALLPLGVSLVTKVEWEKATLPAWRRSSTKIAAGVGFVALLGGLAVSLFGNK